MRFLALGIKVNAEFDDVGNGFLTVRNMNVPVDTGARQHELSGIRTHDFTLLAHGPFHKYSGGGAETGWRRSRGGGVVVIGVGLSIRSVALGLLQASDGVMDDLAAFHRPGTNLDGSHPARLGYPCRCARLPPRILRSGLLL